MNVLGVGDKVCLAKRERETAEICFRMKKELEAVKKDRTNKDNPVSVGKGTDAEPARQSPLRRPCCALLRILGREKRAVGLGVHNFRGEGGSRKSDEKK